MLVTSFRCILFLNLFSLNSLGFPNKFTFERYSSVFHVKQICSICLFSLKRNSGDVTAEESLRWFDEAVVYVRAGSGGAGATTFKFGKARQHALPNGGSGGNGGNVMLVADRSLNTLLGFRANNNYKAEHGSPGAMEFATGVKGADCYVSVPKGTAVYDNSTGEFLGELSKEGDKLLVARGGLGGKGNASDKRVQGEKAKGSPPEGGERRWIRLELTLVADIGLIGVPNAGKSTILDAVTNARPKIADYPFTTIVPNLGVCEVQGTGSSRNGGDTIVIADIPGLVEGAHLGIGLGRKFLKHAERCKMIIHIINGESIDPVRDFHNINNELQLFSPILARKPQVVVINKVDLPHVAANLTMITNSIKNSMTHSRLLTTSGMTRVGVYELIEKSYKFLQKLKSDEEELPE